MCDLESNCEHTRNYFMNTYAVASHCMIKTDHENLSNVPINNDVNVSHVAELTNSMSETPSELCSEAERTMFSSSEGATNYSMNCIKPFVKFKFVSGVAHLLTPQGANVQDTTPAPRASETALDLTPASDLQVEAAVHQLAHVPLPGESSHESAIFCTCT